MENIDDFEIIPLSYECTYRISELEERLQRLSKDDEVRLIAVKSKSNKK